MLTTIILTNNSQKTIEKCLESVSFSNEIIIIDDFSTDQTLEIVKRFKAKIFQHKLNNNFSSQRNFGLTNAKGDWILFLDSDEYLSDSLQIEIKQIACHPDLSKAKHMTISESTKKNTQTFYILRKTKFLGKILNHGEVENTKILRLAKKSSGIWQGKVHEIWNVKGETKTLVNPIIHDQYLSISKFIEKINNYSTIKSQELFEQKIKEPFFYIFLFPIAKFVLNYFVKLGFFDGFPGFTLTYLMSFHSLLVRIKLRLKYISS